MFRYRRLSSLLAVALIPCHFLPLSAQTNLGSVNVGSTTTATVTLTIQSADTLSSISVRTKGAENLDFTNAGGTCTLGTAYSAGATCTVEVAFTPSFSGLRYGAVVLQGSTGSQNAIASSYIVGNGQGAQVLYLPWGAPEDVGPVPAYPATDYESNSSYGGLAFDGAGNIYIASAAVNEYSGSNFGVTKWTPSSGSYVQTAITATGGPGLALDGAGNLDYACGSTICKAAPLPNGTYSISTIASGFGTIFGVAVDGSGSVYAGDDATGILWKETPQPDGSYLQSEIAGGLNQPHGQLGDGPNGVGGITVDDNGNVYVSNQSTTVYKESPKAGGGYAQTIVANALQGPVSVAVDRLGNVYVADENYFWLGGDSFGCNINGVRPVGTPALIEEMLQSDGTYAPTTIPDPSWPDFYFFSPNAVAFDGIGDLYYIDSGVSFANQYGECNNVGELYKYTPNYSSPPSFDFGYLAYGSTSSPQVVMLSNSGNTPLTFSAITFPTGFVEDSATTTDCKTGKPIASGGSCTLSIDFKPIAPLSTKKPFSGDVTFTSNSLIGPQQSIAVSGTELPFTVATPVFSPGPGTYSNAQSVIIADATPGTKIYYTLNGSTPTASSTRYTGPVSIKNSFTLQAIAIDPNPYGLSSPASGAYKLVAATPVASLAGGKYTGAQTVTLATASTGAAICYTTNGSTPTAMSTRYTGPIAIRKSETLKAIAVETGYTSSAVVAEVYTIQ